MFTLKVSPGTSLAMVSAAVMLALIGCASGQEAAIDGVGKFCIPADQVVHDVPWVPTDAPGTPKAFAFAGCWKVSGVSPKNCPMPSSVRGGVISTLNAFGDVTWSELGRVHGSIYGRLAAAPDTSYEVLDDGRTLVVQNKRLWDQWFIWRKARPGMAQTGSYLDGEDILTASCEVVKVNAPAKATKRDMISCQRSVNVHGYSLRYTFESSERVPRHTDALDASITAVIDGWRCSK